MPFVWNPVNGMLVPNQTGAVLDVQYANPAIKDLVQNCLAFVVVNHFITRVCQNPVLVRDFIALKDLTCVKVVSSVKVVVVKELIFTWATYRYAPCVLSYVNKETIVLCVRDVTTKMILTRR